MEVTRPNIYLRFGVLVLRTFVARLGKTTELLRSPNTAQTLRSAASEDFLVVKSHALLACCQGV
jgi:hypothetical protein